MGEILMHLGGTTLYPAIFVGIIFLGGTVLIPALYGTLSGRLDLFLLFITALLAAATADLVWYMLGAKATKDRLYRIPFIKKRIDEAKRFSVFFSRHAILLVFLTKFIWGTRIASHVLAGMHKINPFKFLLSTACGTSVWFFILYALTRYADAGVRGIKETNSHLQIVFLVLFGFLMIVNWFTGSYVRKRMYRK